AHPPSGEPASLDTRAYIRSASQVRAAESPHGDTRPRLTSRPVNRVGAVAHLLEVRSELALRCESATHVLDHDGVPGLHGAEDVERDTAAANHCLFLVVRRARHEHRRG